MIRACIRLIVFLIFLISLYSSNELFGQQYNENDKNAYIKSQKEFFKKVMTYIEELDYLDIERNENFGPCPFAKMYDDFIGANFHSIHTEQAGFLDCDGPTYLDIFNNGLYINNTGSIEYKCYLNSFTLEYNGLSSGSSKDDIKAFFGLPLIKTEKVYVYGCELDVDPFAEEDQDIDESDPSSYIPDFYFVFENDKLIGLVYIVNHMCY